MERQNISVQANGCFDCRAVSLSEGIPRMVNRFRAAFQSSGKTDLNVHQLHWHNTCCPIRHMSTTMLMNHARKKD